MGGGLTVRGRGTGVVVVVVKRLVVMLVEGSLQQLLGGLSNFGEVRSLRGPASTGGSRQKGRAVILALKRDEELASLSGSCW